MNIKYIEDLTNEELVKVFHSNSKLRQDIEDHMLDSEMDFIGEQLSVLRVALKDWNIGTYGYNYLKISDSKDFIGVLDRLENNMPVLNNDGKNKLSDALKLRTEIFNTDINSDDIDNLQNKIDNVALELADLVLSGFEATLDGCYNESYQIDYLIDFYGHSILSDDCYINLDDGDYILYQNEIKSFN